MGILLPGGCFATRLRADQRADASWRSQERPNVRTQQTRRHLLPRKGVGMESINDRVAPVPARTAEKSANHKAGETTNHKPQAKNGHPGTRGTPFLILCFVFCAVCFGSAASGQPIVYVDDDAAPGGNGPSGGTAYNSWQAALDVAAVPGRGISEIRVGQGLYKPTKLANPNVPTSATFRLQNGLTLVGGFAGVGAPNPDERDPESYPARLSEKLNNGLTAGIVLSGAGT